MFRQWWGRDSRIAAVARQRARNFAASDSPVQAENHHFLQDGRLRNFYLCQPLYEELGILKDTRAVRLHARTSLSGLDGRSYEKKKQARSPMSVLSVSILLVLVEQGTDSLLLRTDRHRRNRPSRRHRTCKT